MNEETDGTRVLLGDQRKGIVTLAIPIGMALFFQLLNSIVDNLWVSGLGADALAAVGLVFPLYTVIVGIGNGLGIGVSAAIARNVGRKNHRDANLSAAQGIVLTAIVSAIITPALILTAVPVMDIMGAGDTMAECLDYAYPIYVSSFVMVLSGVMSGMLRGEGAARRSMAIQVAGAMANIVLDPILIYGLGMGVSGAAWATVIAFALSCAMASFWYLRSREMYVRIRLKDYRPDIRIWKEVLSVGGPEAMELTVMYLFNIYVNILVVRCGGTDAVGLYCTVWRIASMIMIVAQAMGGAMVAVCSAEYGMGRFDMIRDAFRYTVVVSFVCTVVLAVVQVILAGPIASVFTHADDLRYLEDDMVEMLRYFSLFLPFMTGVYTGSSLLQSVDKAAGALVNSFLRNMLYCGSCWVMTVTVGTLTSLWWAIAFTEIVGGAMMLLHASVVIRRVSAARPDAV